MKIMFSGGGTLGPVVPLLAIAETCKRYNPQTEFVWVGTQHGPEKDLIAEYNIPFTSIMSGKLRRYMSLWNIFDIFKIFFGFLQSLFVLWQQKPDMLITAGGFVSVPLHYAAFTLGIPTWVHQQDAQVGLANKLMSYVAQVVTTALRDTQKYFSENKTIWMGNPVRDLHPDDFTQSRYIFNIPEQAPVILAMGGGTGSATINKLVVEALPAWPRNWHVIHLVGRERPKDLQENATKVFPNYHVYPFLKSEMKDAYAIADVVITRAGFGSLTELASLGKASIVLPMAGTHQEVNAHLLAQQKAVIVMDERMDSGLKLARLTADLIDQPETRSYLGDRLHTVLPPAESKQIMEIVDKLANVR